MQVTIRQMRAFEAVVRLRSFAAAARFLHISPAAVSLALRELEESLGFRVLDRTTRRVELTDSGRGYLSFVERVLAELDGARRFAADVQRGRSIVRIATTQTILSCLLPPALSKVHARWPDLHIYPLDVAASGIPQALLTRQADLAIGVDLPDDEQFESRRVYVSHWHAYLARSHALGRRRRLAWADLAACRLFMTGTSVQKLQRGVGAAFEPQDILETTTASSGLAMASTGQGVAIFPGYARPLAQVMGLEAIAIDSPAIVHELQVAVPRQASAPASLLALRDMLVDTIGPLSIVTPE